MSNSNHVFVGLPALIKNAAASDPIVSAGDNHISGIGFFDAITGGTINRDDLGTNFRNTNFLAVVGTAVYFYSGASVTDPDWTDAANWTALSSPDLSTLISNNANSITSNSGAISTNASSISTNASNISSNATDISANTSSISSNTSSISTASGDISQLQTDLASESSTRASQDATLLSAIQSNDSDIISLQSDVSTNSSDIQSNTTAISANTVDVSSNTAAIATNVTDIAANTVKISFPGFGTTGGTALEGDTALLQLGTTSSTALAGDTTTITAGQASAIITNTAKTGITSAQASAITANTAKTSFPGFGTASGTALEGSTALLQLGTSSSTALAGDTTTITPAQASAITANTAKTGITAGQANAITANTAKVSADGSVTTHSDVTSAGSGAIITSAERTKLNGIETSATADQTGAEIKTAYEAETKAFTDAQFDKLALIEASATANSTDATLLARANHTGTQAASTISDFDAEVSNNTSVTANTAKTSFPGFGAIAGTALEGNTTTITGGQATAITANTAKVTFPGFGTSAGLALEGNTTLYSQTTLVPTTGSNVVANAASSTVALTSSDGSVTITGSTGALNFAASGGGGSSTQRTLVVPTANNDWAGDVVTFGSVAGGGSFTQGKLYVFRNGSWNEAYGTGVTTSSGMLGIALEQNTTKMLTRGTFQNSSFSFTTSNTLYISALQSGSGRFMDSIPATPPSGSVIRICGYVINGVSDQIFFDPSKDFITLA